MTDKSGLIVDVRDFPAGTGREVSLTGVVSVSKDYCEYEKIPVRLKGLLKKTQDDVFRFEGSLNADLRLKCDLCLSEFSQVLEAPMEAYFVQGEGSEDDCRYGYSGNSIDLEGAVYAEILLNFPMKKVCREGCKGLCPKCGADLNKGSCGCDTFIGNEAFLKLKQDFEMLDNGNV